MSFRNHILPLALAAALGLGMLGAALAGLVLQLW